MRTLLLAIVKIYRKVLSPLLPPACRFYPSCSSYAEQCLERHNAPRSVFLIVRRLSRCHPLHPGGFDPVPEVGTQSPHPEEAECGCH